VVAEDSKPARDPDSREADPEEQGIDLWLRPFITDSTLWPVLVVAVAAFVSMTVGLITLAWSNRSPLAAAALLGIVWISVDAGYRQRREGGSRLLVGLLVALWALTLCCVAALLWLDWI
jgi:hypothetical protein